MSKRFLRGVVARIERAEEHLSELRAFFNTLRDDDPDDSIKDQLIARPGTEIIGIELSEPHPSVRIGETVYNLRATLDYLVFALATLDSGQPQDNTQFPIDDKPKWFARHRDTYLMGVNDVHVARIEDLQPYRGCDWTKLLRSLSNPDKHRHLTSLHEIGTVYHHRSRVPSLDTLSNAWDAAVRGERMDWYFVRTREIAFPDGSLVLDTLEALKLRVAETLKVFEVDF